MLTGRTRLKLADDVTFDHVERGGGKAVILSLKSGAYYTCNETTAAFLTAVDGQRTLEEVVDVVGGAFNVSREELTGDLTELAGTLLAEKLLVVAGGEGDVDAG